MYEAYTGEEISPDQMWTRAEWVLNFERAFNTLHADFSRKDDYLPERIMKEPLNVGPFKGEYMDREKFDKMLDEYYEVQGLDKNTGLQTKEQLAGLGMDFLITYLGL